MPAGFTRLSRKLKIENRQDPKIKAELIVHGPTRKGRYEFFTGLRPLTGQYNTFEGNAPATRNGSKSMVLFVLSADSVKLNIYYWPGYYKHNPAEREQFLLHFLLEHSR